jgi:peptidoglycan/xylan/chitin deacetylase (PgdA/CDA1 family)
MYHGFCDSSEEDLRPTYIEQFRKELKYIKKYFYPLKISDLIRSLESNEAYPKNSVAITVDDGYMDFYDLALPVLKEMDIPATVFIVAHLVENNGWIWNDKVHYITDCIKEANNKIYSEISMELKSSLKSLPVHQRDRKIENISKEYNVNIPSNPPFRYRLMSWNQLRDLAKTGLVEIGSHSCTHPIMSLLNDEESWYEIKKSKQMISERLNLEVLSFCFPNGMIGDYHKKHKEMLKQANYICGIASHFGYVQKNSDYYALPRIGGGGSDFNLFAKHIDGIEYFQRKIWGGNLIIA